MIDKEEVDKLGTFFAKFRDKNLTAEQHYRTWASTSPDQPLEAYTRQCFAEAFHYISKHADSEQEFREWNLELTIKRWEFERQTKSRNANTFLKQILINKALLECQTIGLWCDLIIESKVCCHVCAKTNGKRVTLESVLKGFNLPYKSCKRDDYCTCFYKAVPKEQQSG
jgi:hypothetical protein